MNSRERVEAVLTGRLPDRVPIDFGSTRTSGISVFAYEELKKYLGIEGGPVKVADVYQMLALVEPEISDRLHADLLTVPRFSGKLNTNLAAWKTVTLPNGTVISAPHNFNPTENESGDWIIHEEGGADARMPKDGYYFDYLEDSYSDNYKDVDDMQFETWTDDDFRFIEKTAGDLYRNTCKALVGDFGINLGRPFSFEEWMAALLTEQEYIKEYYDKKSDHIITILESYRQAVRDRISVIFFGQDFGTQRGELISPAMFNELIAPYYRKIFSWIQQNTRWKVLFHTCGSIFKIIPTLIDIGVDILNPVQTSALDMDPAKLKAAFGDEVIFWGGGVDTQNTLPFGTVEEVRGEVQDRIAVFGQNGGYIFNPIHNIQQGVPPENIAACFETAFASGGIYG